MSDLQAIYSIVGRTARRRRWERAWRGAWMGLLIGSVGWLVALALFKVVPLPWSWLAWSGLAGAIAPLAGFILGGWRGPSFGHTARWIDARQQLQERLGTALEMSSRETEWAALLVRDAAQRAAAVEPRQLVPFHLPRTARWAVLALALGAGLGWAPEYRSQKYLQRQADAANVRDAGRQLAELTRRALAQKPPALERTQAALTSVAELGEMFERMPLTRSEALRQLANAAEQLSRQAQELSRNPGLKSLERGAHETGGRDQTPEALQRQIEALQKALGSDKATSAALDKLKAGLEQLQKSAAALDKRGAASSQAMREQLARNLAALAQEARDAGHPLESLDAAIRALEQNQVGQALKDLDVAASDLNKLREMAKTLTRLQQQNAELGRDLAEQLQNGQAGAARATIERMEAQLKSAGLTSEQLEKILQEVSKAIDPAGDYGKVADHLKAAAKQMQQARQSGAPAAKGQAADSLAQAAKELEKLEQQLGDAQSLAASLDALGKAEQAIATGRGWGQGRRSGEPCANCGGRGCALCKSHGWGEGGSAAGGVGTWADEKEAWAYYPDKIAQVPVDNSGVQRPDLAPRGQTDRGPSRPSEALKPTKVQGKMTPGGPMPSIPLKGVSLKGQSNVKFEEAAATAQSEAQNALNQDQVPRVYQGAVKRYFEDLQK